MQTYLFFLFAVAFSYLLGSVCSAVIVCRLFSLPDPRAEGSKNPGATNVLRLAGKKYALMVLVVDMLKGFIPVLLIKALGGGLILLGFTCFFAVIGHMYPLFFGFKGGKGVATAMGGLLGLHLMLGVSAITTWLLIVHFSHYSSLASIVSMMLSPFYGIVIMRHVDIFLPLIIMSLLILYKHRHNINRLIDGNEPKIKQSNVPSEINDILEAELPPNKENASTKQNNQSNDSN